MKDDGIAFPDSDRRPLRVLQLGGPSEMFGAERWILALSRSLPREEVTTVVGVVNDESRQMAPLCDHARRLGLATMSIDAPGRLSLPAVAKIRAFLNENRIDVLHTHGYKGDILGVLAARSLRCVHVSTPHGWSVSAGFKLAAYEALDRIAYAACDAIVPLSEDLYQGLRRLPWVRSRLHLISNGVDLSEIEVAAPIPPDVTALTLRGLKIFGYIGQLIPRKRIDVLIRAFAQLKSPARHLYIVGDGPSRSDLEALAAELGESARVSFTGFREDRLSFLRGFNVFVLPSSLEGIPRCLMEAMAAGVPVVASNIEGCRALVSHGESGLLFDAGDCRGLALHLQQITDDSELRARIVAAGRLRIEKSFSAVRMANQYLRLYRTLIGRGMTRDEGLSNGFPQ